MCEGPKPSADNLRAMGRTFAVKSALDFLRAERPSAPRLRMLGLPRTFPLFFKVAKASFVLVEIIWPSQVTITPIICNITFGLPLGMSAISRLMSSSRMEQLLARLRPNLQIDLTKRVDLLFLAKAMASASLGRSSFFPDSDSSKVATTWPSRWAT